MVARPFASVTTLRAEIVPKSAATPPAVISARSERFRSG
jgi:hypothetical protein